MSLEQWDPIRRKWILYPPHLSHSIDCEKYPFENIPARIFLDTNILNILIKHARSVFELSPIPPTEPEVRANEVEALMHVFYVGQRAYWDLVASENSIEEIKRTRDPELRDELLDYGFGLVQTGTEESEHAYSLGHRLAGSSLLTALPAYNDRVLIGNAIGFGCDVFCTADHRTIINKRHLLPDLGLRILTPIEWWAHVKPWAGLWG